MRNDINKPVVKRSRRVEVCFDARGYRFKYVTGADRDYENGLVITSIGEGYRIPVALRSSLDIAPVEGGPEDWIEAFIDLLRRFQSALRDELREEA